MVMLLLLFGAVAFVVGAVAFVVGAVVWCCCQVVARMDSLNKISMLVTW